jgi:multimeric flavodoxin WrbA
MKKIIALSCGKKNGRCENYIKAAAAGASEYGIETEIIQAMALKILPCNGCQVCFETGKCVHKDDIEWILEKTMVEDAALIMGVPCYHLRANAYFMCINDKMLHINRNDKNVMKKTRVGAIIGVGGSGYDAWASLNLTSANIFLQHTRKLVDQIQINGCGLKEWNLWLREGLPPTDHTNQVRCQDVDYEVVWEKWGQKYDLTDFTKKAFERARQLGRNVAEAMNMQIEDVKYVGEEYDVACPVCHCNILLVPEKLPYVYCPVCAVRGTVVFKGEGEMKVLWNEEDAKNPRFSVEGEEHHWYWLMTHSGGDFAKIEKQMDALNKNFKSYGKYILPEKS